VYGGRFVVQTKVEPGLEETVIAGQSQKVDRESEKISASIYRFGLEIYIWRLAKTPVSHTTLSESDLPSSIAFSPLLPVRTTA
jgi:hypothetical protein